MAKTNRDLLGRGLQTVDDVADSEVNLFTLTGCFEHCAVFFFHKTMAAVGGNHTGFKPNLLFHTTFSFRSEWLQF